MTVESMSRTVINLTSLELTPHQLYIFYLSHSFAPTPPLPNMSNFEKDLEKWISRLRYRFIFADNKNSFMQTTPAAYALHRKLILDKYTKPAPATKSHALELFIENVSRDARAAAHSYKYKAPDNLSKDCRKALNQLKKLYEEHQVIIRPFDKGTGFFLLGVDDYVNRTMVHLSDSSKYRIIEDPKSFAQNIIH